MMLGRLRDGTCANTAGFHHPYGAMIFNAAIPIGFQIANQKQVTALNFKGLTQDGDGPRFF